MASQFIDFLILTQKVGVRPETNELDVVNGVVDRVR